MKVISQSQTYFCLDKKFLVYNLIARNLKVKYRRSYLGLLWTLLVPLASAFVYYTVFNVVLKVQKPDYMILILSGVMAWTYFSQTLSEGVSHYVEHQNLISKIFIPFQVFNFTTSSVNFVTLLATLPVVMIVAGLQGKPPTVSLLLLPYFISCLFLITYASSILAGVCYVFFRDLKQLITIGIQFLFYATPVLYTMDMVPANLRWIIYVNPVGLIVSSFQNCFTGNHSWTFDAFVVPAIWAISLNLFSWSVLRKNRRAVVENL